MKLEGNTQVPENEKAEHKLFSLLVEGRFSPDDIRYTIVEPNSTLKRSDESEAYLDEKWKALLDGGFKAWPNDTKPSRFRLVEAKVDGDQLNVTLDPCVSYRDHVGGSTPEFADRFGHEFAPNPTAVTLLIVGHDKSGAEHILLTMRKPNTDYKPGGFHVSTGGFVEIKKNEDPTQAALRELKEESGLEAHELKEFVCRGVVHNRWQYHPDIVFQATTDVPIEEIEAREHDTENETLFIPTDRIQLQQWILAAVHANTTIGVAGLIMIGKERYGEEWYKQMNDALAWRSADYDNDAIRQALEERDVKRFQGKLGSHKTKRGAK